MTNGEDIVVRGFIKPIATVPKRLQTADLLTGEETTAFYERSDVAVIPACSRSCTSSSPRARQSHTRRASCCPIEPLLQVAPAAAPKIKFLRQPRIVGRTTMSGIHARPPS